MSEHIESIERRARVVARMAAIKVVMEAFPDFTLGECQEYVDTYILK